MGDIWIPMTDLSELNGSLKQIIVEFEDAEKRQNNVEAAIGSPDGRGELRSRCHDFEGGWNDRRSELLKNLQNVQARVEATGRGWKDFDLEAAASLRVEENEASTLPIAP
ncbi:hypothetical protein [Luethyella okanaganae]|uniref:Flagellar protein FlgN n=1 Tax=Luethyella okanaganae TaxID=69372 RepID=A0ABW1VBQ9_9MICO